MYLSSHAERRSLKSVQRIGMSPGYAAEKHKVQSPMSQIVQSTTITQFLKCYVKKRGNFHVSLFPCSVANDGGYL